MTQRDSKGSPFIQSGERGPPKANDGNGAGGFKMGDHVIQSSKVLPLRLTAKEDRV